MTKNLIFDIGNTLVCFDYKYEMKRAGFSKRKINAAIEAVYSEEGGRVWKKRDRGIISTKEMLSAYQTLFPKEYNAIKAFVDLEAKSAREYTDLSEIILKLKAKGCGIYLLSNFAEEPYEEIKNRMSFMPYIDGSAISYEAHSLKPERKIFLLLFGRYNLDRRECILFDNKEENISAAKELGMETYLVKDHGAFREKLKDILNT